MKLQLLNNWIIREVINNEFKSVRGYSNETNISSYLS